MLACGWDSDNKKKNKGTQTIEAHCPIAVVEKGYTENP